MVQRLSTSIIPKQKEDQFAKLVGEFGLWQFIIFASVSMVKLSSGWVQMAILFLTPKTDFWCVEFENATSNVASLLAALEVGMVSNSTCYSDCVRYEYDPSPFESTIVSEWDLICERAWLASLTQTILQLGILIGSVLFGFLSDRYGRKNMFLVSVVLLIGIGFGLPFSPSYIIFTTLRFFLGMAIAGTMVISFVIVMEAIGPSYREIFGCLFQIPFIIGHMTVPAFAYYFRNWDTYLLALAVPPIMYLSYFCLLSESPRWLLSSGRVEEATHIVIKAAAINNLPITNIRQSLTKLSADLKSCSSKVKPNYLTLFGSSLWLTTTCSCVMWLALGFTFFGLNQYISHSNSNPFVSVAAAGAIQIPANVLSIYLIRYFGRKFTTSFFFFLCGACTIALGNVPNLTFWMTLLLGTLGVSFAAIVAASIYIYTSELFPTVVRNMGMGASSMFMRIGSMIAPFVANLDTTLTWLPTLIFGAVPLMAGLVVLLLPETKGKALPDCIQETRNIE